MKPTLYILCGTPGCGKSTFAKQFSSGSVKWISRDEIRFQLTKPEEDYFSHEKEVFNYFTKQVAISLHNGNNTIADATHLNKKSRAKLTRAIDTIFTDYNIIYVYFDISLEICLKRNLQRTGRAVVPEEVIHSMYNNMRVPHKEEDSRCIEVWEVNEIQQIQKF